MMKRLPLVLFALLIISVAGYLILVPRNVRSTPRSQVIATESFPGGFAHVTGPLPLSYPLVHGPHPDYQTEWWYYTGNLDTKGGRHFGFELTFFRRALAPADAQPTRASRWATYQVYSAHFALTDVDSQHYQSFERFERGAVGLAGAEAEPYQVWVDDWRAEQTGETTYHLYAKQGDIVLDLSLEDLKGPVLQGDQGYIQKGLDPGNGSYYYSLTRLQSAGTIEVGGQRLSVEGLSWMDHEFGTSMLPEHTAGWDWFAIQLGDGSELMLYQFRGDDGVRTIFSSGTLVAPDSSVTHLTRDDFQIQVDKTWTSPHSQAEYPAGWTVTVPSQKLTLRIEPYLADQELSVSFVYWEGAVRVNGDRNRQPLAGVGYVEMTGYAGSMSGRF